MIVGGGIVGVAAAFFLAERGERDVLVLERDRLGSGTTRGGLGGIRHQFVDELPIDGPLPSNTLGGRAEDIGVVMAHPAFIHQPRQAASPRQDG